MDITKTTLNEMRDAIAEKTVSATEMTQAYLDRIEKYDGEINAFRETYNERALAKAKAVDAGEVTGPLAGVPIAIKDLMCTEYGKTCCSSKMLANFEAFYNSTAVKRLEDAGAIVLGKTNMDEFAMGSSTETCAFGPTKNPWDVDRVPGGSSGGAAAAMAADFCVGSLGSDTGGSIRQPAALCGVTGMKPTYGRVSRWGLVAFASSLDQIGPFAHSVKDCGTLLKYMGGHDELDSTSANIAIPEDLDDVNTRPEKLRIGIAKQYMSDEANDPAVAAALIKAIEIYKDAGAEIVEVDLPHTEYGIPVYYIVATAEASSNLARYDGVHYGHRTKTPDDLVDLYARSRAEGFGDEVKRRIMLGTYALSSGYYDAYYNKALKVRRLISNDFKTSFEKCDAILCPTTTAPAFKLGEKKDDPLSMYLNDIYTVTANLAGIPGISMPAGTAEVDGKQLPIGMQLLGPAFEETNLLRIARIYEAASECSPMRPKM
ncbi:Asp-tRNA(Asn)/Glu-tRNA(Gln) amidotransferase subunit GatA [Planctomycetota bacterium]|nr:Asp-tRNA(Asn)/Glu-tRNA(Gln) amidotransferase subunit GatA [Planctomycetota bacterium]